MKEAPGCVRREQKANGGTQWVGSCLLAKERGLRRTGPAAPWISDFQLPERPEINACCPSLPASGSPGKPTQVYDPRFQALRALLQASSDALTVCTWVLKETAAQSWESVKWKEWWTSSTPTALFYGWVDYGSDKLNDIIFNYWQSWDKHKCVLMQSARNKAS